MDSDNQSNSLRPAIISNDPPKLISSIKGDKEIATELRKKFFEALGPVAELINEAEKHGFEVGFGFGKNPFGQTMPMQINIMKKY